jgi:hypothetical protein
MKNEIVQETGKIKSVSLDGIGNEVYGEGRRAELLEKMGFEPMYGRTSSRDWRPRKGNEFRVHYIGDEEDRSIGGVCLITKVKPDGLESIIDRGSMKRSTESWTVIKTGEKGYGAHGDVEGIKYGKWSVHYELKQANE